MKKILFVTSILFSSFISHRIFTISVIGTQGTTNKSKSSSTSLTLTSTVASAGDLSIVLIACDNRGSGNDGDKSDVTSVVDNIGNVYSKAVEYSNVQNGAGSGVTVSVWYCVLSAVTNNTSITINFSGSVVAKATMNRAFSITPGNTVGIAGTNVNAKDGAGHSTVTISGLPNKEYLFVHASAFEAEIIGSIISPSYTSFLGTSDFASTTGGGNQSNIGIYGAYKIITGTTATAPTFGSSISNNGDNAGALVAFYEYALPSSLPRRVRIIQ
jgi:hypothetical protein